MIEHGFMDAAELAALGCARIGEDVKVDRSVRIYRADRLELGDHARIDAFSVLSCGAGGISVGRHVHVGAFGLFVGAGRIELHDFCGLSGRVSVYSSNDDYGGTALTGPTVPDELRNVEDAPVTIGRHAIVGAGSVVLPGVTVGEGAAVGSLGLVRKDVAPFTVVVGDGRVVAERQRDLLELEQRLG